MLVRSQEKLLANTRRALVPVPHELRIRVEFDIPRENQIVQDAFKLLEAPGLMTTLLPTPHVQRDNGGISGRVYALARDLDVTINMSSPHADRYSSVDLPGSSLTASHIDISDRELRSGIVSAELFWPSTSTSAPDARVHFTIQKLVAPPVHNIASMLDFSRMEVQIIINASHTPAESAKLSYFSIEDGLGHTVAGERFHEVSTPAPCNCAAYEGIVEAKWVE